MKENQRDFIVYGLPVTVKSSTIQFLDFVEKNYALFKAGSLAAPPRVSVEFSREAGEIAQERGQDLLSVGMGAKVGKQSLYWENEFGFKLFLRFVRGTFEVWAYHFDLEDQPNAEERNKNYQRSMRWAIHFPLFWILKNERNMDLIHASAVTRNGKGLVFSGLNGVGKSSLALYLSKYHQCKLITDNFLLADDKQIYGFPERVRVGHESWKQIGVDGDIGSQDLVYSKYHLSLEKEQLQLVCKPLHVFILLSGEKSDIIPIERSKGIKLMRGMHDYLQEFPQYSFYALLDFLDLDEEYYSEWVYRDFSCDFSLLINPMDWNLKRLAEEVLLYAG